MIKLITFSNTHTHTYNVRERADHPYSIEIVCDLIFFGDRCVSFRYSAFHTNPKLSNRKWRGKYEEEKKRHLGRSYLEPNCDCISAERFNEWITNKNICRRSIKWDNRKWIVWNGIKTEHENERANSLLMLWTGMKWHHTFIQVKDSMNPYGQWLGRNETKNNKNKHQTKKDEEEDEKN